VETVVVGIVAAMEMVAAVEMVAAEEGAEEVVVEEEDAEEEGAVKCHEVLSFLSWCAARWQHYCGGAKTGCMMNMYVAQMQGRGRVHDPSNSIKFCTVRKSKPVLSRELHIIPSWPIQNASKNSAPMPAHLRRPRVILYKEEKASTKRKNYHRPLPRIPPHSSTHPESTSHIPRRPATAS
jgi:hypothetical protein